MAGKPPEVKILGDAGGAKKAAKEAADALDDYGDAIARAAGLSDDAGDKVDGVDEKVSRFGKSADSTRGKVGDLGEELKSRLGPAGEFAGGTIDKVTGAIGKMPPAALAAGGGVAALAAGLGALAVSSVNELSSLVGDMEMLRSKSGASLEEVSRLAYAMDRLGVSTDDLDEVMEEWGAGLEENIPALEAMGVEIARNADGTVNSDKTFRSFLNTLRAVEDPAKRMAMANEIIGESAYRIEPAVRASQEAFDQLYESADEAGAVVNDLDARTVRDLETAAKDLRQAWTSVQLQLARGVAPAFAEFLGNVADVAAGLAELESKTHILGNAMNILTAPMGLMSDAMEAVGLSSDDASDALAENTMATDRAGEAARSRTVDLEAEAEAEREATAATEQRIDAARRAVDQVYALAAADRDVTQAQLDEAEAQRRLTEAVNQHGPTSAEATAAGLRLEAASDRVEQSFIAQAQAQTNVTATQREAAGEALSVVEKNNLLINNLQALANSMAAGSPVRAALEEHIATLYNVPRYVDTTVAVNFTAQGDAAARIAAGKGLLGRAKGGPARAGEPYIVGEEGPELFIPKASGTVIPNDGFTDGGGPTPGGGWGGPAVTVNIYGTVMSDEVPDKVVTAIERALVRRRRRTA